MRAAAAARARVFLEAGCVRGRMGIYTGAEPSYGPCDETVDLLGHLGIRVSEAKWAKLRSPRDISNSHSIRTTEFSFP